MELESEQAAIDLEQIERAMQVCRRIFGGMLGFARGHVHHAGDVLLKHEVECTLAILREGDRRIFRRERAVLGDGWLLAVFSVPEAERQKRHVLRSQLARLGFGTAAPGVWIAPAHLHDATVGALRRLGLDGYADLFRADHIDIAGRMVVVPAIDTGGGIACLV